MTARLSVWGLRAGLAALVLLSTSAAAQGWGPARLNRALSVRDVFYASDPQEPPSYVYVAGEVPTSLRFPSAVDPTGTKLLGWEGRFEPLLIGGKTVVIIPLKNLEASDRLLM